MLKKCGAMLQQVFVDEDIYRAGGDEFMIILPDTNEAEIQEKVAKVRGSDLGFGTACFAVGWYFIEDSKDILKALHIADEQMYADKNRFYEGHPELKR